MAVLLVPSPMPTIVQPLPMPIRSRYGHFFTCTTLKIPLACAPPPNADDSPHRAPPQQPT